MRVDRTWTISFEEHEFNRLTSEIRNVDFPRDLGWRSILAQVVASRQTTLPMRAVERLMIELDVVRMRLSQKSSRQDFQRSFPTIAKLSEEVGSIPFPKITRTAS